MMTYHHTHVRKQMIVYQDINKKYIPESLFPEIEQVLISMTNMKIPEDVNDDKRNLNR